MYEENMKVSERLRGRQRRYRRVSERRKYDSTKNDDTDENEHVQRFNTTTRMLGTTYVPSLVEPRRIGATTMSKTTVPQVVGTKEVRFDEERQYRQKRTFTKRIRMGRNDIN